MECILCEKKTCLASMHYCFLRCTVIDKMKSSNVGPQKTCFELYTKCTEKFHGSKLGHQKHIPISQCVTKLICSLAPDKCQRYTGVWCADGKMINQLDACNMEDNEELHIHVELLDANTDIYIEKLLDSSAWEISTLEKWSTMRQLNMF